MTAAKTRLAPGENSIDRVKVRREKGRYVLDWRIRIPGRDEVLNKRSKGSSIGDVRRRAKAMAKELLQTRGQTTWRTTDLIISYIDRVSIPTIEKAPLRPNTKLRYLSVVKMIKDAFRTSGNTKGPTIAGGTGFRSLEETLQTIAKQHGRESAHHARTVLSKYVLQSLVRDGLIANNLLLKESIDLGLPVDDDDAPVRGGRALTLTQYQKIVGRLLAIVPEDEITRPKQGRFGLEDRVAKRRNTIDVTLLQAATGLRISEANEIEWSDVTFIKDGALIHISRAVSKTHKMRDVPVLIPQVVERLKSRKERLGEDDTGYVIGSPVDNHKKWDSRNCSKAIAGLYCELAKDLDIELLKTARSHVWRTTLNTMLLNAVPDVIRAAYFGHTEHINRDSYTDTTNVSPMLKSFNQIFNQVAAS